MRKWNTMSYTKVCILTIHRIYYWNHKYNRKNKYSYPKNREIKIISRQRFIKGAVYYSLYSEMKLEVSWFHLNWTHFNNENLINTAAALSKALLISHYFTHVGASVDRSIILAGVLLKFGDVVCNEVGLFRAPALWTSNIQAVRCRSRIAPQSIDLPESCSWGRLARVLSFWQRTREALRETHFAGRRAQDNVHTFIQGFVCVWEGGGVMIHDSTAYHTYMLDLSLNNGDTRKVNVFW